MVDFCESVNSDNGDYIPNKLFSAAVFRILNIWTYNIWYYLYTRFQCFNLKVSSSTVAIAFHPIPSSQQIVFQLKTSVKTFFCSLHVFTVFVRYSCICSWFSTNDSIIATISKKGIWSATIKQ